MLLVTGGTKHGGSGGSSHLYSTEILEDTAGTWRITGPLPSVRSGLRAASVENNIFLFGGFKGGWTERYIKDILRYNNKNHTWEEVGQMKQARRWHAVSVLKDVSHVCP